MNILYLSSMCSEKKYLELLKKYNTVSSHSAQKYSRLLVDGLTKNGARVEMVSRLIITPDMTRHKFFRFQKDNDFTYISRLNLPIIGNIYAIFSARSFIKKWLKKNPDGIVLCDTIVGELTLGLFLAGRKNETRVALVTDVPLFRAKSPKSPIKKFFSYIKKQTIEHFDKYILITEQMNDILNKKHKPSLVCEGFADIDMMKRQPLLNDKYKKKVCLVAGLLYRVYGIENLVEAFILANVENSELHIYGNGDYVDQIITKTKQYDNIKYFGERSNDYIVAEEEKATLLVNPRQSGDEYTKYSFPSKNIEYMASGTPVLCSPLPGIPREYNKYFCPISTTETSGLAVQLKTLLQKQPEELFSFGSQAKKWVISQKNNITQTKKVVEFIKGDDYVN